MSDQSQSLVFRLILFFCLLFGVALATRATTVTIGAATIPNIQAGAGTYELRIWLDRTMVDSLGVTYPGGAVDSPTNFKRVSCALASTTVTCDTFTLASTVDAQEGATAKYTAKLYRSGAPLLLYNKPFALPASLGASVTWEQVWRYNNTVPNRVLDSEYYTKNQVNALYSGSLFANPATTTSRGVGKSSVNVADPVFVETTDPRVGRSVEESASLSAAVSALGSSVRRLVVGQSQTVSSNLIIPENLTLSIEGDAMLTVATGVTLTINKFDQSTPLRQVFSLSGTGKVSFAAGALHEVYPEWFGAKGDSTGLTSGNGTDSADAINAALASLPQGGGIDLIPSGAQYRITKSINVIDNTTFNYRFALNVRGKAGISGAEGSGSAGAGGGSGNSRIKWDGPSTTANGSIASGDTTITVASTTNFPSAGWLIIDKEVVRYTGTTSTTFTGCTRGVGDTIGTGTATYRTVPGTEASAHSSGVAVMGADPIFKVYSREVTISGIQFLVANGKGTVAAVDIDRAGNTTDQTSAGAGDVGPRISTHNAVRDSFITTGFAGGGTGKMQYGVRVGQSSNFNTEFNEFERVSFSYQQVAGIYIPNTTRQSKGNKILGCSFAGIPHMVWQVTGSIHAAYNTTSGIFRSAYRLDSPGDSITIIGGNHESDARLLDVSVGGSTIISPITFVGGRYTTNGITGASTLASDIDASTTTIPVVSSASFFTHGGVLKIESEYVLVGYSGLSGNSFVSVTRGALGSTAASHVATTAVTQDGRFITFNAGGALVLNNVIIGDAQPASNFQIGLNGDSNIISIGSSFPNINPLAPTPAGSGNTYYVTFLGNKGVNGSVNVFAQLQDEIGYRNDTTNPTIIADRGAVKQWKTQMLGPVYYATVVTFTDADTTPTVARSNLFNASNSGATTITTFDDGVAGQEITVTFTNGNTTIQNNANVKLAGAADFVGTTDDQLTLTTTNGTTWREKSRSVN